ncbi:hypothetical protein [Saccharopolyspora griseoalba]|uniref:Uncharacterized protein n=1 Tax=Saccharopolyspora griseoalba TaxID=1431848 RepID=A0ABW2LGP3_9PSEU
MRERFRNWLRTAPRWKRWQRAHCLAVTCVGVLYAITIFNYTTTHEAEQSLLPKVVHDNLFSVLGCAAIITGVVWINYAQARAKAGHRWRDTSSGGLTMN